MAHNFTAPVAFDGKTVLAVIVPSLRRNGIHYEVNIQGYPRFWMHWGVTDRYELVRRGDGVVPDTLVLAVSDLIEEMQPKR